MLTAHDDDLLAEYGDLQTEFEALGGYDYESRIAPMLTGLQLAAHAATPISQLSGGQQTRVMLAKQLLAQPDLLILDEPTNHLDIEAVEWLENLLRAWQGALLIVSHDRRFLDQTINKVWEMHTRGIDVYRGNYSACVQQRAQKLAHEQFTFDQEKARLDNEMRLVKIELDKVKGGNDVDVSWAKGKLKRITRDVIAIEQLGVFAFKNENWLDLSQQIEGSTRPWGYEEAERRLRGLRRPSAPPRINLQLAAPNRGSNDVIKAKHLEIGYAHPLVRVDELLMRRGERVALIGANGAGKTTLLKTLLGELKPLHGTLELGPSMRVGYFAQAHDRLDPQQRVMDELMRHLPKLRAQEARYLLAQFLFKDDELDKYVSGLSGGERARLALALLSRSDANLLVLDEPTNHFDIYALEVLQDALSAYDGSMLMVSHDRTLIDALATSIWWIEDRRLHTFEGSFAEWRSERAKRSTQNEKPQVAPARAPIQQKNAAPQKQSASKNAARKRQAEIDAAEVQVARLERQLAEIGVQLDVTRDAQRIATLSADYARTQGELERALKAWEELVA